MIEYYLDVTASVAHHTGFDLEGAPVYAAPVGPVPVRIEALDAYDREPDGLTPAVDATLYALPATALEPGDRVIVGDSSYIVLTVERPRDLDGEALTIAHLRAEA